MEIDATTCGVLLCTWTIHREYLLKRCFSPQCESALPLLKDFETNGVYQNFDFSSPVNTMHETIEETGRSKRKETRGASNISAQLVTALPTRESDVN